MQRRTLTLGAALLPLHACALRRAGDARPGHFDEQLQRELAAVEQRVGGRLGVAVLDTQTQALASRRGQELFALCSTFKLLLAAHVLARVDQGLERLDARVQYSRADLVPYSPRTEPHAGRGGMSVAQLCEATMVLSDNGAANLLLRRQGGPAGLTAWLRALGVAHTRLDRIEPELNDVPAGDERDSTTPLSMLQAMQQVVLGDALSAASRAQLQAWLVANQTGGQRLRAGLPAPWRVGDKTGTCTRASSDVGVVWPSGRAPVLLACYLADSPGDGPARDAAIAAVGRLVAQWVMREPA